MCDAFAHINAITHAKLFFNAPSRKQDIIGTACVWFKIKHHTSIAYKFNQNTNSN